MKKKYSLSYIFEILRKRIQKQKTKFNRFYTGDYQTIKAWNKKDGNNTLCMAHDLNENSIVFEVGGYKGTWSHQIVEKYNPYIYIFEPIEEFYDILINMYKDNKKVKIYKLGLCGENRIQKMGILNNSTSALRNSKTYIECEFKSVKDFIKENNITNIDLAQINIEGGEYELLDSIISNDLLSIFKALQIQFHRNVGVKHYKKRRHRIIEELKKTHKEIFNYNFIFEKWEIKE